MRGWANTHHGRAGGIGADTPRLAGRVDRVNVTVQAVATVLHDMLGRLVVRARNAPVAIKGPSETLRERTPRPRAAMKIQHQVIQASLLKTLQDCVDRRSLLRDEQDLLASREQGCDQVAIVWLLPVPGGPRTIRS